MTTMFPNNDNAMIPDITRGANSFPKTSWKKIFAISRLVPRTLSLGTAHSWEMNKPATFLYIGLDVRMQR